MAGYKGYEFEYAEKGAGYILSPLGERIAHFQHVMGQAMPIVMASLDGIDVKGNETTLHAVLKNIADQHRALIGDDEDDHILSPHEARVVINGTVSNLQVNQNSLGIQITPTQVKDITREIDNASAALLKKVLKEWIPQAFLGASVGQLLGMLGLAVS